MSDYFRNIISLIDEDVLYHLLQIGIIVMAGRVILDILKRVISKFIVGRNANNTRKTKLETISSTLISVIRFFLIIIIVSIILDLFGINTSAIVATAGISGIAIAFGAQSIIKDILTGMMILMDDTIRVGDLIKVAGNTGTVLSIGVRQIKLRNYDGTVITIPNSEVQTVENLSEGPMRMEVTFYLSYDVKIEEAKDMISEVNKKLKSDRDRNSDIIEDIKFLGVTALGELSYAVTLTSMVTNGSQYALGRLAKEYLKEELEKRNIYTNQYNVEEKNSK